MNTETLHTAISEAKRFLKAAEKARLLLVEDPYSYKETAAAKRASMDLTRALAAMRRAG